MNLEDKNFFMAKETTQATFVSNFKNLEVYKRAYNISLDIHKASLDFPKIEQYSLASQMRRASKSICANLAEGFSRQNYSKVEFKRFVSMAIGSCGEMILWSEYCKDLNYVDINKYKEWNETYNLILNMLHKFRIKIEQQINS